MNNAIGMLEWECIKIENRVYAVNLKYFKFRFSFARTAAKEKVKHHAIWFKRYKCKGGVSRNLHTCDWMKSNICCRQMILHQSLTQFFLLLVGQKNNKLLLRSCRQIPYWGFYTIPQGASYNHVALSRMVDISRIENRSSCVHLLKIIFFQPLFFFSLFYLFLPLFSNHLFCRHKTMIRQQRKQSVQNRVTLSVIKPPT